MARSHSPEIFCTLSEGEKLFGFSRATLRCLAEADAIPATRAPFGKAWLIDVKKMRSFLASKGVHK